MLNGPDFTQWIRTFYKNAQSCVINNGTTSDYFFLERGVRQGDPLSPYIFVLAAEALAIAVRQDATIKGILVGGEETKLLQYADVMTAVLADVSSAQALFDLLEIFRKASGLTIDFTKTEGMWIGGPPRIIKQNHLALNGLVSQLRPSGSSTLMIKSCCLKRIS